MQNNNQIVDTGSDEDSMLVALDESIAKETGYRNARLVLKNIAKIARKMPDSVASIDGNTARELAALFLKGVELCGELVSIATLYEDKTNENKRRARSYAMLIVAKEKGFGGTVKEKEAYADIDPDALRAGDEHARAKMFRMLVENKREDLNKAHYLMRRLSEGEIASHAELSGRNSIDTAVVKGDDARISMQRVPF